MATTFGDNCAFIGWAFTGGGHGQGAEPAEAPGREEQHPGGGGPEGGARSRPHLPAVHRLCPGRDQGAQGTQRLEGQFREQGRVKIVCASPIGEHGEGYSYSI
jgi:hypothetical protein